MDMAKIGPAQMDSVSRRTFAEKVKARLRGIPTVPQLACRVHELRCCVLGR